jgi:hypothetical protein
VIPTTGIDINMLLTPSPAFWNICVPWYNAECNGTIPCPTVTPFTGHDVLVAGVSRWYVCLEDFMAPEFNKIFSGL